MKVKKLFKKLLNISMCLFITFYSMFSPLLVVKAEPGYVGKIISDGINFRSAPTTDKNPNGSSNKIGELNSGNLVNVLDGKKISGTGCKDGWLNISYGNLTGYVCSTYVASNLGDSFDRPWTTPKKAIVGGAKFIASSYIAKGQYTSYLKKFNVNPDAYYDQFSHQYMANLAAPASEAATSYNTYAANNLLSLPLEFDIPIFNNMNGKYDRPGGNLIEVAVQDNVIDQNFENYLDAQGFDNTYKRILRALHTKHPNWVFRAMKTNVDFVDAAVSEKNVSSIQGNSVWYDQPIIQTEPGWYLANVETVAYYLDPRNFLTDKYILMFESLINSSNYNTAVVQTVLNGTFMAGMSVLDNQSYASIFVEAASSANVSAVYLASLAKQESGVNLSSTTNGAQFVYDGVTYSGIYNFFNIGAYSSAANPAKAGLVYASGGYCTICGPDSTAPVSVISTNVVSTIANIDAASKGNYLIGIALGATASALQQRDAGVTFNKANIGTGTIATFADGTQYTVVIYGDMSGDGEINSADLLRLRQHLLGTNTLNGAYLEAASISGDGEINSADLLKLRQYLLGTTNINQK